MWCHEPEEGDPCDRTGGVAGGGLQQGGRRSRRHRGAAAGDAGAVGPLQVRQRSSPHSARRRMRQALGARGLRQARRRRCTARDDPIQGDWREDRLAGGQPGRARRIRRRVRRQPHSDAAAVRPRTIRSGGVRPARGRVVDAGGVVQFRRRQRPAAGRSSGRLLTQGRRTHRGRDQAVRAALRRQGGQGVPGQRRNGQCSEGSRCDPGCGRRTRS